MPNQLRLAARTAALGFAAAIVLMHPQPAAAESQRACRGALCAEELEGDRGELPWPAFVTELLRSMGARDAREDAPVPGRGAGGVPAPAAPMPEPSSFLIFATAALAIAGPMRRRSRSARA